MRRVFACVCSAVLMVTHAAVAADQTSSTGRDFPKTLTFDEPGIDDEVSLPTFIVSPSDQSSRNETSLDFELDKRITRRLSVQINVGYTSLPRPARSEQGWQNTTATLKLIAFNDSSMERLVSLSLTREFGGSGAERIGATPVSATTTAINFGQGFSSIVNEPVLKPVAVTGSFGVSISDKPQGALFQQALLSASIQYSFQVLMDGAAGEQLPSLMRPFIPIIECVYTEPTGRGTPLGTLAPGLIYAGEGYQIALEALLPLTRSAGDHAGFIAQLNISLATLGMSALSKPLF